MNEPLRILESVIGNMEADTAIQIGPAEWAAVWASAPISARGSGRLIIPPGMVLRVEAVLESEAAHAERVCEARYGDPDSSRFRIVDVAVDSDAEPRP
ncbi:MAG TPA: hypothetical protein VK066_20065 [Chloroflexota bacterium]|nr:hypothetical protein [Chloroflexota bacterium]